jgi:hypothetical protein
LELIVSTRTANPKCNSGTLLKSQLQIISKGSTSSVSGTLFAWLVMLFYMLANMAADCSCHSKWTSSQTCFGFLLPWLVYLSFHWKISVAAFECWRQVIALRENGFVGLTKVHYGSSLSFSLCQHLLSWGMAPGLNLVFVSILISWMLDGHGDGREVERLGPIGELWRPEMRLLQAGKLGTNCVYGPFGLRTVNFGSLRHVYHQFSSSTTKSKVSLVLLGSPAVNSS